VDRASDSTAGDVAVVMIFLFLHVDGEEREALGFCCWRLFGTNSYHITFWKPGLGIMGSFEIPRACDFFSR
jgi:hypothetical protein